MHPKLIFTSPACTELICFANPDKHQTIFRIRKQSCTAQRKSGKIQFLSMATHTNQETLKKTPTVHNSLGYGIADTDFSFFFPPSKVEP